MSGDSLASKSQQVTDDESYNNLWRILNEKKIQEAKELITNGAPVNAPPGNHFDSILHLAVESGDLELVQLILSKGAFIDVKNDCGNTPLHDAVELNNEEMVKILILKGAEVDTVNKKLLRPIQIAVFSSNFRMCELLILNGAKTNKKFSCCKQTSQYSTEEEDDTDCIWQAVMSEDDKIVRLLIDHNFEVNSKYINDPDFFHIIIEKGYHEIVSDLLSMGAKINSPRFRVFYNGRRSPLHTACRYRQFKIAQLLILFGMDLNIEDSEGKTAIFEAVLNCHIEMVILLLLNNASIKDNPNLLNVAAYKQNIEIISLLLEYGADINGRNKHGETPLYSSIVNQSSQKILSSHIGLSVIKFLLVKGAYVNAKTELGDTALHGAVENNNEVAINTLIEFNAEVNVSNSNGTSPLHLAVKAKNLIIINSLLNVHADIEATDENGLTALHFAAQIRELSIIETLLKYNANVNAVDKSGSTPLHMAVKSKHIKIVEILIKSNANTNLSDEDGNTCLHISAKGDLDIMKLLLNYCKDINCSNKQGWTPLSIAADFWNPAIAACLLDHGADVNITDVKGRNALFWVSKLEIVVSLLEKHADVNCKDTKGLTPLLVAIEKRNTELVKTLLQYNADVNYTGYQNKSPLHFAMETNKKDIFHNLLIYGADVNFVWDGLTPLLRAVICYYCYRVDYIKLLLKFGADTEVKTKEGKTALYIATVNKQSDEVKILLNSGADMSVVHNNRNALFELFCFKSSDFDSGPEYDYYEEFDYYVGSDEECDDYCYNWSRLSKKYKEFCSHVDGCEKIVEIYRDHIQKMVAAHQYVDRNTLRALQYFYRLEDMRGEEADDEKDYNINPDDFINKPNADDEPDWDFDYIESKETEEVEVMKSERIGTSNITFYDFLTSNFHLVASYVKNKQVVDVMKLGAYESKYPSLASMINARFYRGLQRGKLLEKCDFFHHFVQLPFSCIDEILSYLSNQDLQMLINAYTSESVVCKRKNNLIS